MGDDATSKQMHWWLLTALAVTFVFLCSHFIKKDILLETVEVTEKEEIQPIDDLVFMAYEFPPMPGASQPIKTEFNQATQVESTLLDNRGAQSSKVNFSGPNELIQTDAKREAKQENLNSDIDVEDLKEVNMMIKMPSNDGQVNALSQFLYQCINIGFGFIDRQQSDAVQVIHSAKGIHSNIFRQTQQALFENEKHWRRVYGASNQYVRIYPAWLDRNLISNINQNLNGEQISSLSAQYSFQNNLLQLINITLNGRPLAQAWTLANGFDLGCR